MAHMNQKLAIANMLCRNVSNGVLSKLFRSKFRLAHRMACSPEAFVALRHVGMTACGICACITKSSHFPKKYKKNCFVPAAPDVQRDLGQIQAQLGRTGLGNAFLTENGWMECPQQKFLATNSSGVATSAPCHCRHACGANPTKYKKNNISLSIRTMWVGCIFHNWPLLQW